MNQSQPIWHDQRHKDDQETIRLTYGHIGLSHCPQIIQIGVIMKLSPASSPLKGSLSIPGDKSISHRAVMFGALADGPTEITNFLMGADCLSTIACFKTMGVDIDVSEDKVTVHGAGLRGLHAPASPLDCGNSGTTMRLIMGILSAQHFPTTLTGDASLVTRPMGRVAKPLGGMGAQITSENPKSAEGKLFAPLSIHPAKGEALRGVVYESPVASAQVKSAILLAGLYADAPTTVIEPAKSRDHTERMLSAFGAKLETGLWDLKTARPAASCENAAANTVTEAADNDTNPANTDAAGNADTSPRPYSRICPCEKLTGQRINVPGDISSAAYFLAAATLVPGSEVLLKNVGINPTRDGFLRVLKAMGGDFELQNEHDEGGEPCADILVRYARLHGTKVCGDIIPTLIDELPMVAVMAACAEGETIVADAAELAVKESNRIETVAEGLRAMGAHIEPRPDGWVIRGCGGGRDHSSPALTTDNESSDTSADPGKSCAKLKGAVIDSHNDHRIAMSFAIAALAAEGETEILHSDCIDISYPAFFTDLNNLT